MVEMWLIHMGAKVGDYTEEIMVRQKLDTRMRQGRDYIKKIRRKFDKNRVVRKSESRNCMGWE